MASCLGPFCGRFRDELGDSSSSGDEEDDTKMRVKRKKKKGRQRIKMKQIDGSATLEWAPFITQVNIMVEIRGVATNQQVTRLEAVGASITPSMLQRVNQLTSLYTLHVMKCNVDQIPPALDDMDGLAILSMPHNNIRLLAPELGRCNSLEQIILDWNRISDIPPGIFSTRTFNKLEVISLSHNRIAFLPSDFGQTSRDSLKHIDLSYNMIQTVPEKVVKNSVLQELNLSHNRIRELPESFELPKLKKLFVSFNELTKLPDNIGDCRGLEKLRMTSNQVRELPVSILKLWNKKPNHHGQLQEFYADKNPLVMPSITAFEMVEGIGGMDRAFHLLEEHHKELAEKRQAERSQSDLLALEEPLQALEHRKSISSAPIKHALEMPKLEDGLKVDKWYLRDLPGNKEELIQKMRESESAYLAKKRKAYIDNQRLIAKAAKASDEGALSEDMKVFSDEDCFKKFRGSVPTQDTELCFALLVYTMKAEYDSVRHVFDKFEDGNKGYMKRSEWLELCSHCPLDFGKPQQEALWKSLLLSSTQYVTEVEFTAAFHIHDIEARDSWIVRLVDALRLDYFDMTISEMEARVRAKRMLESTARLDYKSAQLHEHAEELLDDAYRPLAHETGTLLPALKQRDGLRGVKADSARWTDETRKRDGIENLWKKVSLDDYEHQGAQQNDDDDEDKQSAGSALSLESDGLSDQSDSGLSEFDAQAYFLHEDWKSRQIEIAKAEEQSQIHLTGDRTLRKLMEVPVAKLFRSSPKAKRKAEPASFPSRQIIYRKRKETKKLTASDPRWKTDVFEVRKALREVYRNLPYRDFIAFIEFLLRGLRLLHGEIGATRYLSSYWHVDDPSFKFAMGIHERNKYTRRLLLQMGFVKINNLYWIWPSVHLSMEKKKALFWADSVVSEECPGKDKSRLDEMIKLLSACAGETQRDLNRGGGRFTGHFHVFKGNSRDTGGDSIVCHL